MSKANNIFLVGPMGAGKTSVGRQLAKTLAREFLDSDKEIESRTGVDIPTIFDIEGEAGFRKREQQMLDELTQREDIVLATGGGAILSKENREWLQQRGTVIYLGASVDQLYKRTRRDRNRPLLQTENPRQRIADLLAMRDPLYRETADITLDTDGHNVRWVVEQILAHLPG
ncbi:shikimate kinase AroK [Sulfuriflexus sp.]|uniref:shikimate kinase AroK n=1 Tax=Sulfuriflexus sp. TaxID=2015443 RepID=UPI0028CBDF08|nr:shikimate kinase AroK [Sulfuriflexus sp.]MDT8403152.1 shikimate kinase AroK [Sulfuriflexus sp.]